MVSRSDGALVVTSAAAAVDVVVLGVVVGTVVSAVLAVGVGVVTGNRSRPTASSSASSNKSSLKMVLFTFVLNSESGCATIAAKYEKDSRGSKEDVAFLN
jgi:hypothetical protein